MKKNKTLEMVQLAVLIAIMLILAFTPLGYLRIGPLAISLMTIPVVIGAMILGPQAEPYWDWYLDLPALPVFCRRSFWSSFGSNESVFHFPGMHPYQNSDGMAVRRDLQGTVKIDKTKTVTYFVTGLLGAFMNTLFFMSTLMICFGHTEYLQSMNATGANLFMFAVAFCGINGALEMPMSCVVGGGVAKAVSIALKKNAATEEK